MGDKTGIEWTDATWNPIRGCSRVSLGCMNCYAEGVANRFKGPGMPYEGLIAKGGQWNGAIKLVPGKLSEPLRWKKPRMIFVNSMSDLFHENVPFSYIHSVMLTMQQAERHIFQVLTKRPVRMLEFFRWWDGECIRNFAEMMPNVWLGVSVEDQITADQRIPLLLQTPAAVRWISAEPLLGPIEFDFNAINIGCEKDGHSNSALLGGIDWVVVGGESGAKARPMEADWVRSIRDECLAFDVPFFFKQWGEYAPNWLNDENRKQVPGSEWMDRIGKKKAGSILDGCEHKQWPAV